MQICWYIVYVCAGMWLRMGGGLWFRSYLLFMKVAATVCGTVREIPRGASLVTQPVWESITGSRLNRKHLLEAVYCHTDL